MKGGVGVTTWRPVAEVSRLSSARLVLGAAALLQPRAVASWWGADPDSGEVVPVARVLGARHVTQAVLLTVRPSRSAEQVGAAVDVLHAVTMLLLAGVSPRCRRPAATSACVALALTAGTVARLRRVPGAARR
jgi:hypothetical protein